MTRDHKAPAGPRPAVSSRSPARSTKENINPVDGSTQFSPATYSHAPMLSASSSNNHSLFSFGQHGASASSVEEGNTGSLDFLPSVSFDDLQSSLETASTDFKLAQFPSPTGHGSILGEQTFLDKMAPQQPSVGQNGGTTRAANQPNPTPNIATRSSRAGSILRRPSTSDRQTSIGSSVSAGSSIADAPTAPAAMRNRRQSHYPPVSNSNIGKPPRKSIGPGVIEADFGSRGAAQKRRPSLMSNVSDKDTTMRSSMEVFGASHPPRGSSKADNAAPRGPSKSSNPRTVSIQPPPKIVPSLASSTSSTSTLTPDGSKKTPLFPRSPKAGPNGTPGSAKRASVMPGHAPHIHGLGARTISPTDAQRMKRMSMHQSQSLAQVANAPPPPPPATTSAPTTTATGDPRSNSRSPSMIPRKTSTPSSSRTTPDITRKSYSSGLSVASAASFNTHRTSTGSLQRGAGPNTASSRLPAPKSLSIHTNPPPAEEEEDVPPVPAIPKVYESPKDAPPELSFFEKPKSNIPIDASSINSNSTGTLSNTPSLEPGLKTTKNNSRKPRHTVVGGNASDLERKASASQSKKNLAPLRLPPISLGPLSTPTAAKIASLKDSDLAEETLPPPHRGSTKTPTTPMTASKSSFFSRGRADPEKQTLRSSSSIHRIGVDSSNDLDTNSSTDSLTGVSANQEIAPPAVSPFLSSSVPKSEIDFSMPLNRSKTTTADMNHTAPIDLPSETRPMQKPTGPRAQNVTKLAEKSTPVESSPEAPSTPSGITSLRRKLSLSLKRSKSKGSMHPTANGSIDSKTSQSQKDSMPPPRLPLSATLGSLKSGSPSHAVKPVGTNYLESRRRKSSASSLNAMLTQDKPRTDAWPSPKKSLDIGNNSSLETSGLRSSSMQRILRPRPSVASIKQQELYTGNDLDKDDMVAEDEMKKLASKKKETEIAARTLDALQKRATPKERVGPHEAIRIAMLNIYERGEIVDHSDVYFCGTQNAAKVVGDLNSSSPNFGYDDDRGDYTIVVGDHLSYRYEVVDVLGKGSFGQVVRCIDHKTGVLVAVKIIRNKKRFHQQALVEVNILQKLREWDPRNKHSMVNFTHSFYFRGHLCISTELLDMNLYEFIKSNSFRGFSLKLIRRFTKQMLSSLNLLKQHKVIHCDLKPENILLRHPMHSEIKVIDFGSSCFENEKVYTYIQSRFYRSPEVILGMTYGLPIDIWSLGCILAELYTGVPIFPGENEQEQLACIMEVFGPPEKHLIEKSTRKKLFFDSMGKPRLTVSSKGRRRRPSSKTLQQVLKCDDEPFLDFLTRCLRWDPDRRLKPEEAIRHQFITGQKTAVPVPRAAATRESSPVKRHNTISTPRPLPEPPTGTARGGPGAALRPGMSPQKVGTAGAGSRRTSGINGPPLSAAAGPKRTSTGQSGVTSTTAPSLGGSSLPRVAGRSVSAKQDLASAGAHAAMSRRI